MLDYHALKNWEFADTVHAYGARDASLYALAVGLGADPLDEGQLRYFLEPAMQVVPSFAATLAWPGMWWRDPRTGVDATRLVQGEQHLELHRPLAAAAVVVGRQAVESVTDKGADSGAVAVVRRRLYDQSSNALLAELRTVNVLRGDGGYSGSGGASDPGLKPLPPLPERMPDHVVELATLPQSALLYRLTGDANSLHADPAAARSAGFPRPILHGLASLGYCTHAVLKACCGWDAQALRGLAARFTAPVFPGEALRFELWRTGPREVRARGWVDARSAKVLDRAVFTLA